MLSNTAETKPRPSVDGHDAVGNCSTGIIDAHSTSDSRKMLPLIASGTIGQSGRRQPAEASSATHTAAPITGKWSSVAGLRRLKYRFATTAATSISTTIAT